MSKLSITKARMMGDYHATLLIVELHHALDDPEDVAAALRVAAWKLLSAIHTLDEKKVQQADVPLDNADVKE